jgi:hypothetical protein
VLCFGRLQADTHHFAFIRVVFCAEKHVIGVEMDFQVLKTKLCSLPRSTRVFHFWPILAWVFYLGTTMDRLDD